MKTMIVSCISLFISISNLIYVIYNIVKTEKQLKEIKKMSEQVRTRRFQ